MAVRGQKETAKANGYLVEVTANPSFCGVDVGNVQFAHGKAEITDPWLAEWYRTHEGYRVTPMRGVE